MNLLPLVFHLSLDSIAYLLEYQISLLVNFQL